MIAIIEGILVAAIWASSFVFVKMGLIYMGPLTMAGLRYFLAALVLLPWLARHRAEVANLPGSMWLRLTLLGLCAYTIANGAFYWGLRYLSATTVSFLMSFNPLLVLIASLLWLKEFPSRRQLIGLGIALTGGVIFFVTSLKPDATLGLAIVLLGLVAFSAFGVLGRDVARQGQVSTLVAYYAAARDRRSQPFVGRIASGRSAAYDVHCLGIGALAGSAQYCSRVCAL